MTNEEAAIRLDGAATDCMFAEREAMLMGAAALRKLDEWEKWVKQQRNLNDFTMRQSKGDYAIREGIRIGLEKVLRKLDPRNKEKA
jgi:hypothetical protein